MPKGLRLKEKVTKESVPRNHKNNVKTGLRLKEKLPKKNRAEESQEQCDSRLAAQKYVALYAKVFRTLTCLIISLRFMF